jgi:carboxymethylenebutenolidase
MEPKKGPQLPAELVQIYNVYIHGGMTRREFFDATKRFAVGGLTAAAIVEALMPNYALGQQVPKDDKRLKTEYATVPSPQGNGNIKGYLVRPANATGKLPAVLVVHENRGLNPHIEDVTRRAALEGFLAIAPDLLSPMGGTPENEDTARDMIGKLDGPQTVQNLVSAITFLEKHANGNGKVGVVGFCWGGGMVGVLAVNAPDLDAGVVYYGRQPKATDVEKIKAPLLLHYAGQDTRINEGIPAFEEALKKARKPYTLYIDEGAQHAFNNDTSEARYNKSAAEQAWSRTIAFFKEHLKV